MNSKRYSDSFLGPWAALKLSVGRVGRAFHQPPPISGKLDVLNPGSIYSKR